MDELFFQYQTECEEQGVEATDEGFTDWYSGKVADACDAAKAARQDWGVP